MPESVASRDSLSSIEYRPRTLSPDHGRRTLSVTQRTNTPLEQQDRALLIRTDRWNAGQVFAIEGRETTLGRHPDNVACVEDEGISRLHAKVCRTGDLVWIEDLGSRNGTHVNGRPVTRSELNNGDTVQLGARVSFRFSMASAAEELALRRLYESSVRDSLTQAFNRAHFERQASTEIAFATRHQGALAVLLLDVDFFKRVNDRYGHLAGDEVLRTVSDTLRGQLRAGDIFGRFGGEEFVALLRGTAMGQAVPVAERLRTTVERGKTVYQGRAIEVTISIGIATLDKNTCDLQALLARADARLYRAKEAGRNRVVATD